MGRHRKSSTIEVHEGVYIKRLAEDGAWHCYFKIANRQFRRSTKTRDLVRAKQITLGWFNDAQRKRETGQSIDRISFAKLKRSYLESISAISKVTYHRETIERHFLPFFAKFEDVSRIKGSDILDYLAYRNSKGEHPPTPQTINRENTVLRQLLAHAVERAWINAAPTIRNFSEKLTRRRRRSFTADEFRILCGTAEARCAELEGIDLSKRAYWQRKLVLDAIQLMANSGIRVDELHSLTWRDIDWASSTIKLDHAGKTKSSRRIIVRDPGMVALRSIHERRAEFLARDGATVPDTEVVVCTPDGTPVASLKKGFSALLAASGFVYKNAKDRHSLTSLRHFYATARMTTKEGTRASMRGLAMQMGTSERMIEKHYGHDTIDDYRDELS